MVQKKTKRRRLSKRTRGGMKSFRKFIHRTLNPQLSRKLSHQLNLLRDTANREIVQALIEGTGRIKGNLNAVIRCVEKGADINRLFTSPDNYEGFRPLSLACAFHNREIIEYLLSQREILVNKDTGEGTALRCSVKYNFIVPENDAEWTHCKEVQLLLDKGAVITEDVFITGLGWYCSLDVIDLLKQKSPEVFESAMSRMDHYDPLLK